MRGSEMWVCSRVAEAEATARDHLPKATWAWEWRSWDLSPRGATPETASLLVHPAVQIGLRQKLNMAVLTLKRMQFIII